MNRESTIERTRLVRNRASEAAARSNDESDLSLLDRFVNDRDQAAFEALIVRHGSRVMGVCRQWLGNGADADDAFQATFLVLVQRAGEIHTVENLSAWLGGVARRVASRAKFRVNRQRGREGAVVEMRELAAPEPEPLDAEELAPLIQAEIARLPEKFRRPVELCYSQGLSNEQAASYLGCPSGTVKWRLSRAREMLRSRLVRLGLALAALLMLRRPTYGAGVMSRSYGDRSGASASGASAEFVLSESLVRRTVLLATALLDTPLIIGTPRILEAPAIRRIRRKPLLTIAICSIFIAMTIAGLLAIPAVQNKVFASSLQFSSSSEPGASCHSADRE